jgi:hypothetical protein
MTDLMHDWKRQRFVVLPGELVEGSLYGITVLMSDYNYWADHVGECVEWCSQHGCRIQGMTIEIPDEETLTLFSLKWS